MKREFLLGGTQLWPWVPAEDSPRTRSWGRFLVPRLAQWWGLLGRRDIPGLK